MSWALLTAGILTTLVVLFVLLRIWSEKSSGESVETWSSDSER